MPSFALLVSKIFFTKAGVDNAVSDVDPLPITSTATLNTKDASDTAFGSTTAPSQVQVAGGKTSDTTPQY